MKAPDFFKFPSTPHLALLGDMSVRDDKLVQHRAEPGSVARESAELGYCLGNGVPESYLIGLLEGMGFELVEKSEINANPKDTRDYPDGVWTLPPTYRLGDKDRAKYTAMEAKATG